jgi:hypothetical protein
MSEARTVRLEDRLDRLEGDVHDIKGMLARLEPMIIRIDERLQHVASQAAVAAIKATLTHLATKAEMTTGFATLGNAVAGKPTRAEMWA